MYIKMIERDAGKKQMIITILNSMSPSERKEFLNGIYGVYVDTDSIKVIKSLDSADLMAIKNEFEQIHGDNEAIEVEIARIDDEIDKINNATKKTFKKVYKEIKNLYLDSARINAQAETIEKLCKIVKFILPRVNASPFNQEYQEIKSILEDIYKEF